MIKKILMFRFIAFKLESNKSDSDSLYNINKEKYPEMYNRILSSIETKNKNIIELSIKTIYDEIYMESVAQMFDKFFPLNINIFDMVLNTDDSIAIKCWQQVVNIISKKQIKENGILNDETIESLKLLKKYSPIQLNEMYSYMRIKFYISSLKKLSADYLIDRVIKLNTKLIKIYKKEH